MEIDIYERPPLPYPAALRALARCSASTARLLRQHRLRLPARWVGTHLHFADGTSARVYRETVADRGATLDPCVLVVEFRLRAVRGLGARRLPPGEPAQHPAVRRLPRVRARSCGWPTTNAAATGACTSGTTRGLAENYARALWRVLALVSVPGSIHYVVLPGLRRDAVLDKPQLLGGDEAWWRLTEVT